ncbi:SDR family NAD(P)-dependent oxidoreductase [Phenylobacterium sp.]|uniref:SDR family NAD(P)-dependent oxidoreductase n=1 Tax=Phenylobacterium sp. TaxID=1871053 RepID=UPI002737DE6A|nr:SDR family NAD(P)-dependent oxidoreductase [Phenylobacterium sp.]MDP3869372.1 SDR family NAD(P)-dependent oxidoreductase [Phenylobacterium sp.]
MSGMGGGPVAIVTGGARGIGRGCALALAEAGYDLVLVDVLEPEMASTARELEALGRQVLIQAADVSNFQRAQEVVGAAMARFGRIDVLLNNAGRSMAKGMTEITEAEFDATIAVNLKSCFNYIHAVAPIMLTQGGGRIVSMSSLNAHSGGVTAAVSKFAYAAAKAGILGMTRALAKELGPTILVNAICPGLIQTEVNGNVVIRERGEAVARDGIALGRVGSPQDVAQLVRFLATSEPCFITGQDFIVDGFQFQV